jgi:hypothetical protein
LVQAPPEESEHVQRSREKQARVPSGGLQRWTSPTTQLFCHDNQKYRTLPDHPPLRAYAHGQDQGVERDGRLHEPVWTDIPGPGDQGGAGLCAHRRLFASAGHQNTRDGHRARRYPGGKRSRHAGHGLEQEPGAPVGVRGTGISDQGPDEPFRMEHGSGGPETGTRSQLDQQTPGPGQRPARRSPGRLVQGPCHHMGGWSDPGALGTRQQGSCSQVDRRLGRTALVCKRFEPGLATLRQIQRQGQRQSRGQSAPVHQSPQGSGRQ